MTEPTDAELIALLGDRQFSTIGAVREALRRWGTPPAVAGEPVAWRYRPSAVWDDYVVLTDDPGKAARARGNGLHVEALCLATPQPTQAQAGAEPLTDEQKNAMWVAATIELPSPQSCYLRGMADAERAHGITKGGQHG